MGSLAVGLIVGALLFLAVLGGLLALQIWLAARPKLILGFIQPGVWFLVVAIGNLASHSGGPNPALESGIYGWGAIVMGGLSLLVYLGARWRLHTR